jgi:MinD-like ATPase involved in chromosome partitioning or flagellar assembly
VNRQTRILIVDRGPAVAALLGEAWAEGEGPVVHHLARPERLLEVLDAGAPYDLLVAGPSEHDAEGRSRVAAVREGRLVAAVVTAGGKDGDIADTATSGDARRVIEDVLRARSRGKVTAVIGVSGGAGRTTVALCLADLVARGGERAVVVDASLQFGAVGAALERPALRTLADVLYDERGREQSADAVAETLAELAASARPVADGFAVVAAPRDPVDADRIGPERLGAVIGALAERVDRVVVDTAAGLGPETLAVLDIADDVVVVATLDVPGMAALRTVDALLDQLGIAAAARHLILNKELSGTGLPARQAAETLDRAVAGVVPFDPEIVRARNHGRPATALGGPGAEALRLALSVVAPAAGNGPDAEAPPPVRAGMRGLLRSWTRPSAVAREGMSS